MISIFFITWMATIVPHKEQYYCKLEWVERGLCHYKCGNKNKVFMWFEKQPKEGCVLTKQFYKA